MTTDVNLKEICARIDTAFRQLPLAERNRAIGGMRSESLYVIAVRDFRSDHEFIAHVVWATSTVSLVFELFLFHTSSERFISWVGITAIASVAFCLMENFIPEPVTYVVKHLSVGRLLLLLGLAFFRGVTG